ncbi:MAG: ATP-binding protein [Actinomycetota bacterium]|nr:ATP-binding protein [Actinomycetota bacterium]
MTEESLTALVGGGKEVDQIEVQIGPQFLELFSEHMYSSPNKAFEELVSNSWDAGATVVHVGVPSPLNDESAAVWVLDNGVSMDIEGFRALWAVATSNKLAVDPVTNRPQIGKFGIGKLATYLLAHQLTYICKAEDGAIRAITMDYRMIDSAEPGRLHIDPVPLKVREVEEDDLREVLSSLGDGSMILDLLEKGVPRPDQDPEFEDEFRSPDPDVLAPSDTWTLAILTSLKPAGKAMVPGTIKWILRTALPLGESIVIVFNGERLPSSKVGKDVMDEWVLAPGLGIQSPTLRDGREVSISEGNNPVSHIAIEGIDGIVTGQVRLYADRISGGKSADVAPSNGFFVNILGRVINWDDPYFGLKNLNHSAWAKFRATVRADGLNAFLAVNREGVQETPQVEAFRAFLLSLFNKARAAYDAAAKAAWPDAGDVLTEQWGTVPLAPLRRVIAEGLVQPEVLPGFVDVRDVDDIVATRQQWEDATKTDPAQFISEVVLEELGSDQPMVVYQLKDRRIVVNKDHPFSREHGETHEQQLVLRDSALAEILTDAFMADLGIDPSMVEEVRSYRDEVLRLVARVRRRTGGQIAEMLLASTAHAKGFETILSDALEYLGFDVERKGASGEPEGVATAPITAGDSDQHESYSFTYDAKSSGKGKSKTGNIKTGTLEKHRKKFDADYILVVAPAFEKGGLEEECQSGEDRPGITPMRAQELGELLLLSAALGPLDLTEFRSLFSIHDPDAVSDWIKGLRTRLQAIPRLSLGALLRAIDAVGYDSPDALTTSVLAREIRQETDSDFPSRIDVTRVVQGLTILIPNVVRLSGDRILLAASADGIRDALRTQLAGIPSEFRFGLEESMDA